MAVQHSLEAKYTNEMDWQRVSRGVAWIAGKFMFHIDHVSRCLGF
jgi:hypothetical protein